MKIEIDLVKLTKANISADDYIFLYLRLLKKQIPKNISCKVDVKELESKGFIKVVDDGFVKRQKLLQLFDFLFKADEVASWIDEWRDIWPIGVKSAGKPVRGSREDCLKKMKVFLSATKYTKAEVMAATLAYVIERKNHKYQYMTLANYFIKKDDSSPLESWCEMLKTEGPREETFGQFHKEI